MSKALLVALREYMENMKTKAFWIGIGIFPVLFALMIAVPIWMDKGKDVRTYVVIDKSGWLLEAVEKRAEFPDMEKVLEEAFECCRKKKDKFEEFPEVLRHMMTALLMGIEQHVGEEPDKINAPEKWEKWFSDFEKEKKKNIKEGAEQITRIAGVGGIAGSSIAGSLIPENKMKEAQEFFDQQFKKPILEWWKGLPPEEAKKFAAGLAKSRYQRMEIDTTPDDIEDRLKKMLNEEELFAYFVIEQSPVGDPPLTGEEAVQQAMELQNQDPVAENGGCKYVSNNLTDMELRSWFTRLSNKEIYSKRIQKAEIASDTADWIQESVVFEAKKVSDTGVEEEVAEEDTIRHWAPVVFVYLLWISVFTITQMLLTNTIEEKSNKIIEVLLSSVSPLQLMAGKILGIACTGLTMVLSWIVFFLIGLKLMPVFIDKMPDFDLSLIARDPIYLASFVGYFILGYLLLAAILVGIGSVCSSLKEAQNLMAPVTIIMIVPLLAMMPIGENPNGTIAKVMSYIPPFTPFVMMNRAAGPPSPMEYVVTTLLLLVSIVVALWAAAKIFRVGILMTGKPPKLMEILKLIRAPVGHVQVRDDE
jgi:ABC-type Na+ efflux pump permease subunit